MNILLEKKYYILFIMKEKINTKRAEHKKKLKEIRAIRLERQLKANILKRKKVAKNNNG